MTSPAWTAARTWTDSELITAAILNTHVRDNLNHLKNRIDAQIPSQSVIGLSTSMSTSTWTTVNNMTISGFNPGVSTACILLTTISWSHSAVAGEARFRYRVNGVGSGNATYGNVTLQAPTASTILSASVLEIVILPEGSNTIDFQIATSSGTLNASVWNDAQMLVMSLRPAR